MEIKKLVVQSKMRYIGDRRLKGFLFSLFSFYNIQRMYTKCTVKPQITHHEKLTDNDKATRLIHQTSLSKRE
jgi:hypothetical protein